MSISDLWNDDIKKYNRPSAMTREAAIELIRKFLIAVENYKEPENNGDELSKLFDELISSLTKVKYHIPTDPIMYLARKARWVNAGWNKYYEYENCPGWLQPYWWEGEKERSLVKAIKLRFSGGNSRKFWDHINSLGGKTGDVMYYVGVQLQNYEEDVEKYLTELTSRIESLEKEMYDALAYVDFIEKSESKYCSCGDTETWFDRSQITDGEGNLIQDMCDRCCKCGKEKLPKPDNQMDDMPIESTPDEEVLVNELSDYIKAFIQNGCPWNDLKIELQAIIKGGKI